MSKNSDKQHRRFNSQLEREVANHAEKLQKGRLSLPSSLGKLVIVVSGAYDHNSNFGVEEQIEAFNNEADQIAEARIRSGRYAGVEVKRTAVARELEMDFGDKEVSDMILIGHGNISDLWIEKGGHFHWLSVAKSARFLKQGKVEQRMCGNFRNNQSVPLGTFALADQRNLIAPLGVAIDDLNPDETAFQSVYSQPRNDASAIIALIDDYIPLEEITTSRGS